MKRTHKGKRRAEDSVLARLRVPEGLPPGCVPQGGVLDPGCVPRGGARNPVCFPRRPGRKPLTE